MKYNDLFIKARAFKDLSIVKNSNLKGVGISILSLQDYVPENLKIYLSEKEIAYSNHRLASMLGRYAGKLATREALKKDIPWKEMNILPSSTSQPILSGLENNPEFRNFSLSITHEDDLVVSIAAYADKLSRIAVGIDATKICRLIEVVRTQPKVLSKILTEKEMEMMKEEKDAAYIWAGKEAVSKALGIGVWHGGSLREIEVLNVKAKPEVVLKGKTLKIAKDKNLKHWSLDFIENEKYILAMVVAMG